MLELIRWWWILEKEAANSLAISSLLVIKLPPLKRCFKLEKLPLLLRLWTIFQTFFIGVLDVSPETKDRQEDRQFSLMIRRALARKRRTLSKFSAVGNLLKYRSAFFRSKIAFLQAGLFHARNEWLWWIGRGYIHCMQWLWWPLIYMSVCFLVWFSLVYLLNGIVFLFYPRFLDLDI